MIDDRENDDVEDDDEREWAEAQASRASLYSRTEATTADVVKPSYKPALGEFSTPLHFAWVSANSPTLSSACRSSATDCHCRKLSPTVRFAEHGRFVKFPCNTDRTDGEGP
jgi:hypothetical protein